MDSGESRNDVSVNESVNNYGSVRGELVEPYAVSALFRAR